MRKAEKLARMSGDRAAESLGKNRQRVDWPAPVRDPRFDGVSCLVGAATIEVDRIVRDPNQPRQEFSQESLERLAASLKSRGQLQPVRVRWDGDRYVLITGERRWRAAKIAGLPAIAAIIHEGELTDSQLLVIQLADHHEPLKPIEQARAFRSLMDRNGWTTRQLVEELNIALPGQVTFICGEWEVTVEGPDLSPAPIAAFLEEAARQLRPGP
jgi:ParB family chromosome partitioning protein